MSGPHQHQRAFPEIPLPIPKTALPFVIGSDTCRSALATPWPRPKAGFEPDRFFLPPIGNGPRLALRTRFRTLTVWPKRGKPIQAPRFGHLFCISEVASLSGELIRIRVFSRKFHPILQPVRRVAYLPHHSPVAPGCGSHFGLQPTWYISRSISCHTCPQRNMAPNGAMLRGG